MKQRLLQTKFSIHLKGIYSSSVRVFELFLNVRRFIKIQLSEQIVNAGKGISWIAVSLFAIRTTIRLSKNFSAVWKIKKKKMAAEIKSEKIQKQLQ